MPFKSVIITAPLERLDEAIDLALQPATRPWPEPHRSGIAAFLHALPPGGSADRDYGEYSGETQQFLRGLLLRRLRTSHLFFRVSFVHDQETSRPTQLSSPKTPIDVAQLGQIARLARLRLERHRVNGPVVREGRRLAGLRRFRLSELLDAFTRCFGRQRDQEKPADDIWLPYALMACFGRVLPVRPSLIHTLFNEEIKGPLGGKTSCRRGPYTCRVSEGAHKFFASDNQDQLMKYVGV